MNAPRFRVERIDETGVDTEKEAAARNGWLSEHGAHTRKSESPFQLEPGA